MRMLKALGFVLFFILLGQATAASLEKFCASMCQCYPDLNRVLVIDCKDSRKISPPIIFPPNTVKMVLTGSDLGDISAASWREDVVSHASIRHLDLSESNITDMAPDTFNVFPRLKVLILSGNHVQQDRLIEALRSLNGRVMIILSSPDDIEAVKAAFPQHRVVKVRPQTPPDVIVTTQDYIDTITAVLPPVNQDEEDENDLVTVTTPETEEDGGQKSTVTVSTPGREEDGGQNDLVTDGTPETEEEGGQKSTVTVGTPGREEDGGQNVITVGSPDSDDVEGISVGAKIGIGFSVVVGIFGVACSVVLVYKCLLKKKERAYQEIFIYDVL